MSRLNIPLSTSSGTRRHRRVLWIVLAWLAFVLISVVLANVWFNRDTLSGYAPDNSTTTVHLYLSKQTWTKLLTDFGNLPLITDRPLTIRDLASYKPSEISIFILENNTSAVAIRTSEDNLPKEILTSYGINLQKLGRNRWLLSSQPLPFSIKGQTSWSLGSIWPGTLGKIQLSDFSGFIRGGKTGYSVEIPKTKITGSKLPSLPDNTVMAAVIQSNTNLTVSPLTHQIDQLLEPLGSVQSEDLVKKLQENGGLVLLSEKADGVEGSDFLIETKLDSTVLSQILQISAAFKNTTTEKMEMPDGSTAEEMIVNPSLVEFVSVWIGGEEAKSVQTAAGQILTLDREAADIITSNSQLLEAYLLKKTEKNQPSCGSKNNLIYLKPKLINQSFFGDHNFVPSPTLLEIALRFEKITLDDHKINLCY
ncbi:MAG: hypothetical protein V1716_03730 [Candidatus Uhrbacteria bacterium]